MVTACSTCSVAHQTSGRSKLASSVDRRHFMTNRQRSKLSDMACKKSLGTNNQPAYLRLAQVCEDCLKLRFGAGLKDMELQPEHLRCRRRFPSFFFGNSGTGWIDE